VSVRDFGAFVDLGGGVQGLIHISEMDWARVTDAAAVVAPGQDVSVKVLRVDEAAGQIALGLKQLTADPWTTIQEPGSAIAPGAKITGTVERVAKFGVFVALAPGLAIALTVLALNVLGDGIRDALDPRAKVKGVR
jgi:small subunit ribosomal protein S1